MSIISSFEVDSSAALARRFAALATGYLTNPQEATSKTAAIPLENLFRILEMCRYNAFSDESRRGVLALEDVAVRLPTRSQMQPGGNAGIAQAVNAALTSTFGSDQKNAAIDEVQEGLRQLARGELPDARATKVRAFLVSFESSLA
jgi:hypothetical protein